jgi:hypothetical protein
MNGRLYQSKSFLYASFNRESTLACVLSEEIKLLRQLALLMNARFLLMTKCQRQFFTYTRFFVNVLDVLTYEPEEVYKVEE